MNIEKMRDAVETTKKLIKHHEDMLVTLEKMLRTLQLREAYGLPVEGGVSIRITKPSGVYAFSSRVASLNNQRAYNAIKKYEIVITHEGKDVATSTIEKHWELMGEEYPSRQYITDNWR